MPIPTLLNWFEKTPFGILRQRFDRSESQGGPAGPGPIAKPREQLRVGIPRVLNQWSTHQFWIGFLGALGIEARRIEFSGDIV